MYEAVLVWVGINWVATNTPTERQIKKTELLLLAFVKDTRVRLDP